MSEDKKVIREDINFLEYANWVIDPHSKSTSWVIEKEGGKYEILAPKGLPSHFDKLLLYFLLHKMHSISSENNVLEITRYEIARNLYSTVGKRQYDRIFQSLQKWNAVSISFEGTFYENDGYTIRLFHIIDSVTIRKNINKMRIKFNSEYLQQLRETRYVKWIDYEQYKKFSRPVSARLYEILVKNFKDRNQWVIGSELLAEKLTLEKRPKAKQIYLSDVMAKLIPAAKEINEKSDIRIKLSCHKENSVIIFNKIKVETVEFQAASRVSKKISPNQVKSFISEGDINLIEKCWFYYQSLSEEKQKQLLSEVDRNPFNKFLSNENIDALKAKLFTFMKNKLIGPMSGHEF